MSYNKYLSKYKLGLITIINKNLTIDVLPLNYTNQIIEEESTSIPLQVKGNIKKTNITIKDTKLSLNYLNDYKNKRLVVLDANITSINDLWNIAIAKIIFKNKWNLKNYNDVNVVFGEEGYSTISNLKTNKLREKVKIVKFVEPSIENIQDSINCILGIVNQIETSKIKVFDVEDSKNTLELLKFSNWKIILKDEFFKDYVKYSNYIISKKFLTAIFKDKSFNVINFDKLLLKHNGNYKIYKDNKFVINNKYEVNVLMSKINTKDRPIIYYDIETFGDRLFQYHITEVYNGKIIRDQNILIDPLLSQHKSDTELVDDCINDLYKENALYVIYSKYELGFFRRLTDNYKLEHLTENNIDLYDLFSISPYKLPWIYIPGSFGKASIKVISNISMEMPDNELIPNVFKKYETNDNINNGVAASNTAVLRSQGHFSQEEWENISSYLIEYNKNDVHAMIKIVNVINFNT